MYVSNVELKQLRVFADTGVVRLLHPDATTTTPLANVNLLLGDNGAGKSAFLKGVALGVLAQIMPSPMRRQHLVRRDAQRGAVPRASVNVELLSDEAEPLHPSGSRISAHLRVERRGDYEEFEINVERTLLLPGPRTLEELFEDESPAFFCLGYGTMRRAESPENFDAHVRKQRRGLRYLRVAGLFEDFITLVPLGVWLPELRNSSPQRFEEIEAIFGSVLPAAIRFTGRFESFDPLFERGGVELPFDAHSDGYRAHIALVSDILYHLNRVCPPAWKLTDMSGLVMVDDIDLHLHPAWQREVVPKLARAFPQLQFILTTHSPIVAGTLHAENILVVEESENGSVIRRLTEPIHGRTADQILTSSYFNLDSPRSPAMEEKLQELATRIAERRDPTAAIEFLRSLSGNSD